MSKGVIFDPSQGYAVPLDSETSTVNTVATSGATQTLPDPSVAAVSLITLSANCALTFPTPAAGKRLRVYLKQDGTGSRTVTWDAAVKWPGGTAPTLTTTANKMDGFDFECVDGSTYDGRTLGLNY